MDATLRERVEAHRSLPSPVARRAIRLEAGLSQADIGRECGVGPYAVSRWENGSREPRGDHLVAYAAVLAELKALAA